MKKKSTSKTTVKRPLSRRRNVDQSSPTFPIVGIGASAGGLEASVELLKALPGNLGMAYVFVHHLSPDYQSNLTTILQKHTSMRVEKVEDGLSIERDHVYVILPNTFISLEEERLKVSTRSKLDIPYHPIDYFLISLAREKESNAIGIILSGTATDGTLGLKAIKQSGGITIVQDKSARHQQMPRNAQEAGYADFVLSPNLIVKKLTALTRHPYVRVDAVEPRETNADAIRDILKVILERKGVDFFSHYKRNTVLRRIIRRMALANIIDIADYYEKLLDDDQEVDALYHDFLINVTSFFREPAFYRSLGKNVFPRLFKNLKPMEQMRIWIAGCATGEEAYSTAICLSEFMQEKKLGNPVHIFATDLNSVAIEKARLGIYPKGLVQHLSPQRLKKFFVKIDGHYQIIKPVREMCIFSQHNLLKDPPFSRMDLVSCQNVLIYLENAPQQKILQAFHYALKPSGFLLLGKSESIGNATELFQAFEKDSRLFTKKSGIFHHLDFGTRQLPVSPATILNTESARMENDIEKESDKLLLTRYTPASVLVNKDLEIIRFRGATSAYLEPASGKASFSLLKMIRDGYLFDVKAALQKAKKTGLPAVQSNVLSERSETGMAVSIEVTPINKSRDRYYLIVFKEVLEQPPSKATVSYKRGEQSVKIQKLQQALINARDQVRIITEEFEGTREELQSANEEILSSNEELQSINEELETSKEELQSSNEELTTINEELQNRNTELKQAHDYTEAIIETMRGPLMVLNSGLRVRTANLAFYDFFRLTENETEGTFLFELCSPHWNIPGLRDQLQELSSGKTDFKDFLVNADFSGIGNKFMIINAHRLLLNDEMKESLILLSFEDITRYKKAEQSLLETQEQLKLALSGGSVGTWMWNIRTNEMNISGEEARLYGLPMDRSIASYADWERTVHPDDLEATREALKRSIETRTPLDTEFRVLWPDGSIHWILAKADPYIGADGKPERMLGVNIDVTERRRAIEALTESEKRFHTLSDQAPVMIWMAGPDRQASFLNKAWLAFRGKSLEEESGSGWMEGVHPDDMQALLKKFDRSARSRQEFKIDYRLKRHDGEYRWIMTHAVPRFTGDNEFLGFIGTCVDITDRIELERQKDDFMGIASHELKTPVTSIKAYAQILQEKFRKTDDTASLSMLTRLDMQIDKLTGLINTLLDVAKVQSGQMDYVHERFDINDFAREVVEEVQPACRDHKIVIQRKTSGEVYADKARIARVLNNLISNAVKYSPGGKDIIVSVEKHDGKYVVSVQDFGVGIPENMQDKIFGRFFRVSEASGNRVSGLGLGLFISSEIIKQHGGALWLESQQGKGSKFFFSLPVGQTEGGR